MAYNIYPYGYQQQYQYQPTQYQPTQSNGVIWVQGEAGAKSYLVAPNTTVQLWDSEEQVIYLKSADASGMPSMRILDYTIRDAKTPGNTSLNASEDFPTRKEFEALKRQIEALRSEIEGRKGDESTVSKLTE